MVGQGSPSPNAEPPALHPRTPARRRCAISGLLLVGALVSILALTPNASRAEEISLQLRIAWGGGTERQWSGAIALSQGEIAIHRPLGIEADEPGSMWVEGSRVEVRQRSVRAYDGVDVFITAPADAKLSISMLAAGNQGPSNDAVGNSSAANTGEVKIADLISKPYNRSLDDRGNRLLVRRAPGDMLQVRWNRDSLVFSPGETLSIDVRPHLLPLAENATLRVKARLLAKVGGDERWNQEQTLVKKGPMYVPEILSFEVPLPTVEGVYDLLLEAAEKNPLRWNKPVASRGVQLIVVSDEWSRKVPDRNVTWIKQFELDPANPGWADRLKAWPLIPGMSRAPLGNGQAQTWQHVLGPVVQLGPGGKSPDIAWEAYPLSIARPGTPHILEVEYPGDVSQTLGISLLEPNAAGAISPIGLDSGLFTTEEPSPANPAWAKHRLIFWPRTKSPLVLLNNRRDGARAAYGKLRVLSGPAQLPPAFHPAFEQSERLFAGYLDRPLFCENFSAGETLDPWSGRSLDDWQTFYEGSSRLVEYLNHVGYNGLMMAVMSEGSTIYPSQLIDTTPRYDTGVFLDSAQDPVRKDAVELLLRLFDREKTRFIPALQFHAPLPELEARLRRGGVDSVGIRLIGADGVPYTLVHPPKRGLAPYYNPLDEHVQQAMLAVVRELVQRYSHHPSFAGLAVELSADGFAQLPGEAWGFDDATVARFEQETRIRVPSDGPNRFQDRARLLLGPQRKAWLNWRARVLADFHGKLQRELLAARPDALFYLAATNLLDGPDAQRDLRPGLPARASLDEVLLGLGLSCESMRQTPGVIFLRPHRIAPPGPLSASSVEAEAQRAVELDRLALVSHTDQSSLTQAASAQSTAVEHSAVGSLFLHEPQRARVASFDVKSPFGKDKTYTWLVSQLSPTGSRNRQRFVHSLATLDSDVMFDGGWLLPLGQEDPLADLIASYRRLPAGRFETLGDSTPVTVRTLVRDGRRYVYFVNDSAWPMTTTLQVSVPPGTRPEELSGLRKVPPIVGNRWTVELGPFDLLAVRFTSKDVKLSQLVVTPPARLRLSLEQRIDDLRHRRAVLENPPSLALLANAGFETVGKPDETPNWMLQTPAPDTGNGQLDSTAACQGNHSLRLTSTGPGAAVRSDAFAAPQTGRLRMSVWLRVGDVEKQPAVRLAVEGLLNETEFHTFALVGAGSGFPLRTQWSQYVLPIEDLPTSGLSQLRVRVEVLGAGQVWIDDVQLFDLVFKDSERLQLDKLIALTSFQLQSGNWGECLYELDGYWPRFLLANVPLSQQSIVNAPALNLPKDSTRPAAASDEAATRGVQAGGVQSTDKPPEKQATRPGVLDRMNGWWKR